MTAVTASTSSQTLAVEPQSLRASVREKYGRVATEPDGPYHFHTGRRLAQLLGYDQQLVQRLPDRAVESFAGVGNPFSMRPLGHDDRVVDIGSGGGFDAFVAAELVGPGGRVIGVDMTPSMLEKSRRTARLLGLSNVDFREGIAEALPVDDGWADVVISNGVLNLIADKPRVFSEIHRVLRDGGRLQFADIAVGTPVPRDATCSIDLWTDCIAGGQSLDAWCDLLRSAGFTGIETGPAVDTFGGAPGEPNARRFEVYGHAIFARKP